VVMLRGLQCCVLSVPVPSGTFGDVQCGRFLGTKLGTTAQGAVDNVRRQVHRPLDALVNGGLGHC
jgi:hypothetical protein